MIQILLRDRIYEEVV